MRGRGAREGPFWQRDEVAAPARDPKARALREARRSGFLNLPARGLSAFPSEALHLEQHLEKDEKPWECVDLSKLDLSHNAVAELPDDIAALASLVSFKMRQNALQRLPDGFFDLTALVHLDLSRCGRLRGRKRE